MIKPTKWSALQALAPNSKFVMDGDGTITNHTLKGSDTLPSESEIDTKLASMISDWESQSYARTRRCLYPDIGHLYLLFYLLSKILYLKLQNVN